MPNLTNWQAVGLAEGFIDGDEEEVLEAWQHLVDSGIAWVLQGWFGRTAEHLIEEGFISRPLTHEDHPVYIASQRTET
jgi:hypothetical protein